jgi:predicted GNAT family acetyltransferase
VRIGPVYTPPEQRRRGYAGACVGALSQLLLAEGRDFCVLYTDTSNPTSNHVYQMLGYQPIMEASVYTFGA